MQMTNIDVLRKDIFKVEQNEIFGLKEKKGYICFFFKGRLYAFIEYLDKDSIDELIRTGDKRYAYYYNEILVKDIIGNVVLGKWHIKRSPIEKRVIIRKRVLQEDDSLDTFFRLFPQYKNKLENTSGYEYKYRGTKSFRCADLSNRACVWAYRHGWSGFEGYIYPKEYEVVNE